LPAFRVVEAIKAQFKNHSEVLGDLSHLNSKNVELREFLSEAASRCHAKDAAYVFIVDGLDHALRYERASELEEFLSQVCNPQPGLWIILGMQEVAKPRLPQIVFDQSQESEWIRINGLNDDSVDALILQNSIGLELPDLPLHLTPILIKIRSLTKGNPLHLRYTLRQVKEQVHGRSITDYDLRQLLPYDTEIENYYKALWAQLSDISKCMLIALRCIDESIREDQFLDLAGKLVDSVPDISEGYRGIRHLLMSHRRGLGFFHSSMGQFVSEQQEWNQQLLEIKRRIKDWLEQSDYDQLKWSLLPLLEEQLGNPDLLLQIDREWLLQAIYDMRSMKAAKRQLAKGAEVAFKSRQYSKVLELSTLNQYFENALDFQDYLADRIWDINLRLKQPRAASVDFSSLSLEKAMSLSRLADQQDEFDIIEDEVIEQVQRIHRDYDFRKKGDLSSHPPEASTALITVATLNKDHDVRDLFKYIVQFRDLKWTPDLFTTYVETLIRTGQSDKVKQLLKLSIEPVERTSVIDVCSLHDLDSSDKTFIEEIYKPSKGIQSSLAYLHRAFEDKLLMSDIELPDYSRFPDNIPEFESKSQPYRKALFVDSFVKALALSIVKQEQPIDDWIKNAPPHWSSQIMCALFRVAKDIGKGLCENTEVRLEFLYEHLSNVQPLEWPDDRDSLEWQRPFHEVVTRILQILIAIRSRFGQQTILDYDNVITSIPRSYLSQHAVLRFLIDAEVPLLSRDSFEIVVNRRLAEMEISIDEFPSRTSDYLDLTEFALLYGDREQASEILKIAIDNVLGYGSHKDPYLGTVIEAIEICKDAGSLKGEAWTERIASMAEHASDFADGRYLPKELGVLLSKVSPGVLYKYYVGMADKEELFLAQELFAETIGALEYDHEYDVALGSTALDKDSLTKLREVAVTNQGAARALEKIEGYFGDIEFKDRHASSSLPKKQYSSDDIEETTPSELSSKLNTLDNFWDKPKYLKKWSEYWIRQDESEATKALMSLVEHQELNAVEGELLDIVFPLIYKEDTNKAFEILCWAQANDGGWSRNWTNPAKAEARWEIVRKDYPTRYHEFFEKSVQRSGFRYDSAPSFYVPFPRALQYFAMFGDLSICEELTEQSVRNAEELMANLILPDPSWHNVAEVNILDLLLQRLEWPSSYVRERAATALADLLQDATLRMEVLSAITRWIASQSLESKIVLGILPVIKALHNDDEMRKVDLDELVESITVSSPVIMELISEMERATGKNFSVTSQFVLAPRPPSDYEPSKFFNRNLTGFLAPFYLHQAEGCEKRGCDNFLSRWAYTADVIRESLDIQEQLGGAVDFLGGRMGPVLSGMSSKLSEVYRTAFLRTINAFHKENRIDNDHYKMLAYSTMPVELSYWDLLPSRLPNWWPKIEGVTQVEDKEQQLRPLQFVNPIDELIEGVEGKLILGMEGAIKFPEGWAESASSARITMIAFGYDVRGNNIPDAEAIAGELLYSPMATIQPTTSTTPFRILESKSNRIEYPVGQLELGDLSCQPMVCRNRDLTISLWQGFRNYSLFSPNDVIGADLQNDIVGSELRYHKNGNTLAVVRDWLDGFCERNTRDLDNPHGVYILADKDFVMTYLASQQLRLGFIVKITYRFKKYDYEEAQIHDDYRLYNVSSIIV